MGQHVAHLAEEVVAYLVSVQPHVDVHPADEEAPRNLLQLAGEGVVAFLAGAADLAGLGKGGGWKRR